MFFKQLFVLTNNTAYTLFSIWGFQFFFDLQFVFTMAVHITWASVTKPSKSASFQCKWRMPNACSDRLPVM
jgi:hypothetical protein